jgi:hypothetical protein
MAWTSELNPAQIQQLDDSMEPKLSPEDQAELDARLAELDRAEVERKKETWGSTPAQQASTAAAMELLGVPEG